MKIWIVATSLVLLNIYLSVSVYISWAKNSTWCDGVEFLVTITFVFYLALFYYKFWRPKIYPRIQRFIRAFNPHGLQVPDLLKNRKVKKWSFFLLGVVATALLIYDAWEEKMRLISGVGLTAILIFAYVFSVDRKKILWRPVVWGVTLQFVFALLILRLTWGRTLFVCIGEKLRILLENTDHGSTYLYGYLNENRLAGLPVKPVFFFHVLSIIFFSSCCISVLYYYGVMQTTVKKLGWLLQVTVGTTACESMNAAANIFLGPIESPLIIRPYIKDMTKSELHAVLAGGFATVAGTVFAAFVNVGGNASHLLSASVMSAPASLALAKLLYPELEKSKTQAKDIVMDGGVENHVIEAAVNGAVTAVSLVGNIASNLLAFMAAVQTINTILAELASYVGLGYINLQWLAAQVLMPLTYLMGVEWQDCSKIADLIGIKTIVHPFLGYAKLGILKREGAISVRSEAIANYALCGFSHLGAMGIQLGGVIALAPERRADVASVAFRALLAGSLASFMTACAAGLLLPATKQF